MKRECEKQTYKINYFTKIVQLFLLPLYIHEVVKTKVKKKQPRTCNKTFLCIQHVKNLFHVSLQTVTLLF